MAKQREPEEAKPKKKRTKRETVVLEVDHRGGDVPDRFIALSGPHESVAKATKWVRENGEKLKGKTITIASLTPPRKVEIETKSVVKF